MSAVTNPLDQLRKYEKALKKSKEYAREKWKQIKALKASKGFRLKSLKIQNKNNKNLDS